MLSGYKRKGCGDSPSSPPPYLTQSFMDILIRKEASNVIEGGHVMTEFIKDADIKSLVAEKDVE